MSKPINLKAFVIQTLRRASYRWIPRNEALKKARISRGQYQCKICGPTKSHDRKNVSVDHRIPVVDPIQGFTGWQEYVERMFCNEDGFDVLCNFHHDEKSAKENAIRKASKPKKHKAKRTKKKSMNKVLDELLDELEIKIEEKASKD